MSQLLTQPEPPETPTLGPVPPLGAVGSVLAVFSTSGVAARQLAAAYLAKHFVRSGIGVGYARISEPGGSDHPYVADVGSHPTCDATGRGHVATYLLARDCPETTLGHLIGHLRHGCVDVTLLELPGELPWHGAADVLSRPAVSAWVDGALLVARDVEDAVAGMGWLRERGIPVLGLTGAVVSDPSASELTKRTGVPVYRSSRLGDLAHALRRSSGSTGLPNCSAGRAAP